jgi:hypothetical protein
MRGGKFNPDAAYMREATDEEREQLDALAGEITARNRELQDLRARRQVIVQRISTRAQRQ